MTAQPIIDEFTEIVSQEEIAPACECHWHKEERGSAEWIVWRTPMCCRPAKAVLWCNACLVEVLNFEEWVRCKACGSHVPPPKNFIIQYERLNP